MNLEPRTYPVPFALVLFSVSTVHSAEIGSQRSRFVRGDVTSDYQLDVSDAVLILKHLFLAEPKNLDCADAGDCNDDGQINIADPLVLLFYLYEGDPNELPYPYQSCGIDPTSDDPLRCVSYWACGTGPFLNSAAIQMLPLEPGSFMMGSPETERGRYTDEFQHEVVIGCPFYMCETEITQGQYLAVMGTNPSWFNGNHGWGQDFGVLPARCLESVTWDEAVEFCRVLSDREGRRYRLPYEAEWEYVCRAGTLTRFSFGDALDCYDESLDKCFYPSCTSLCSLASRFTHWPSEGASTLTVKSRDPNPWGFYGMHDNVAEWCMDWYGAYPRTGPVLDPRGPEEGQRKVARGWIMGGIGLKVTRSASRWGSRSPTEPYFYLGFRIVAELPECSYGD